MSPDFLIALTILSNFVLVATSRVNKAIQVAVIQGVLLGLIPLAMGLGRHPHILFMVAGADKASALQAVLYGEYNPDRYPAQIVSPTDGQLTWLIDRAASDS